MLTKFETKSNRVKGLSFHPKRCADMLESAAAMLRGQPAAQWRSCSDRSWSAQGQDQERPVLAFGPWSWS